MCIRDSPGPGPGTGPGPGPDPGPGPGPGPGPDPDPGPGQDLEGWVTLISVSETLTRDGYPGFHDIMFIQIFVILYSNIKYRLKVVYTY